ncbi:AMP-binding protein [Streptomyces zaomyceticus]|uniref:AMP-binding protein n=1 Tax=Streptomyces zaomyceticus TaxID=68286 RepID=UPI0033BF9E9D
MTAAPAGQSADFETVATESADTAVIPYTSGTTGRPKGAELTHSNVMLNVLTCRKLFGEIEHDVHLITLPLFHSFGQVDQMNAGIASRATLVLLPRFAARSALALMQRHAVTFAWRRTQPLAALRACSAQRLSLTRGLDTVPSRPGE